MERGKGKREIDGVIGDKGSIVWKPKVIAM